MENTNIYIDGLPADMTGDWLNSIFASYGTVTWSKVMPSKGKPSVSAIVEFGDIAESKWCVENLNGNIAQGLTEPIQVMFKRQKGSGKDGKGGGKGKDDGKGFGKSWAPSWGKDGGGKGKGPYGGDSWGGKGGGKWGGDSWGKGKGDSWGGKGGGKWGGDSWGGKGKGKGGGFRVIPANAESTVWLGDLPEGANHEELKTMFEAAGTVKRVQVLPNGTGFAWFSDPQEALQAITLFNGTEVNGKAIVVDPWTKKS